MPISHIKEVVGLYKSGKSLQEVSSILQITVYQVLKSLDAEGIGRRKPIRRSFRVPAECPVCTKTVMLKPSCVKYFKYCSRECYYESLKQKPVTDKVLEHLRKISRKGVFKKGHVPYTRGKNMGTFRHIRSLRMSKRYFEWRESIFERDNYTCQICHKRGGGLNADHVKPLSHIVKENRIASLEDATNCVELWDMNNGRTLCVSCHKKTPTFGGRAIKYKQSA